MEPVCKVMLTVEIVGHYLQDTGKGGGSGYSRPHSLLATHWMNKFFHTQLDSTTHFNSKSAALYTNMKHAIVFRAVYFRAREADADLLTLMQV